MANIYDMAGAIQQPNAIGNFNQGVQIGQQNQVYGQKQAAYQQALGDQQNIRALAPQVIAGDPGAFSQVAAIDPSQAQNLQSAGDAQLRRLSGAIQYIDSQKDPQAKEAAYQQSVKPYLAQLGQATGKVPPATFAEAEPMMEAARAKIASFSASQPSDLATIGAGGAVYDKTHQRVLYQNPGVPHRATLVTIHTPNGDQQAMLNPDGTLSALKIGGQPGAQPQVNTQLTPNPNAQSVAADQATALVSTGMDPGQAAAMAMAQHPGTTLAFDAGSKSFRDVSNGSEMIPPSAGVAPAAAPGAQASIPPNGQPAITQGAPMPSSGIPDNQNAPVPTQTPNIAGESQGQPGMQVPQGAPSPLALPGGLGMSSPKASAQDMFSKNKEFADKLKAAGAITTQQEYTQVLTTGKLQQSDSDVALSPSDEAVAKGIATYAVLPSSLGRSKNRAAIIAHALEINPDYTEANAKGAYTYINDLSKSGTTSAGGQVQSINTGLNHLGTLMRANGELSGTDFPYLNRAKNFVSTETGGTAANNWKQATYLFSQEMAKLVKGGVANEGEVRDIVGQLDASLSPEQRAQAIQHAAEFMYGRIQSVEDRGDRVLGSLAPNVSLMTKEAQDNLRAAYHLGGRDLPDLRPPGDLKSYLRQLHAAGASAQSPTVQSGEQGTAQFAQGQSPINAPGQQPQQAAPQVQPRAVNSMGHAVVWNGSAWVPE